MRQHIDLYIADQLVNLDESSFILFNYTMEDLSNPTIVRNSFSKQITIPGTPNNNKIFGGIYRLDRVTQYGGGYTGVDFDVMRKTPFSIFNDRGEVLESGYMKLDGITKENGMVQYKISLFGGIGSFFYSLQTTSEGNTKTLASMVYKDMNGNPIDGNLVGNVGNFGLDHNRVDAAWSWLAGSYTGVISWYNILNFAPCYNGIPDGFEAKKIIIPTYHDSDKWINVYRAVGDGEGQRGRIVMSLTNPHTEWELRDLRWYLQRPVISMKEVIDAICNPINNGGYEVELDSSFFNASNPYYNNLWMTLSMIPIEKRTDTSSLPGLLASTKSPAEYIISYAKMLGLIFLCDNTQKRIKIMQRSGFFSSDKIIDLSKRINVESIAISPVLSDSRYYQFGGNVIGEWAKQYKDRYDQDYGIWKVNTGNEFNNDVKQVTSDIVFKEAIDVSKQSMLYYSDPFYYYSPLSKEVSVFPLPAYENVTIELWRDGEDGKESYTETVNFTTANEITRYPINEDYPGYDFFPKVQLQDESNKAIDGSDVLVFFDGFHTVPTSQVGDIASMAYQLSDDDPTYQGDKPCWQLGINTSSTMLSSIPCFRRNLFDNDGKRYASLEYGNSLEVAYNINNEDDLAEGAIYPTYWQRYQTDRYDADTFTMSCKVNLRGLRVNQELMGSFFYYENSLFVLNSISNHSLTTDDDTECVFVRVQDMDNYIN